MKTITDYPTYEDNPFKMSDILTLKKRRYEDISERREIVLTDTGEMGVVTLYETHDKQGDYKEYRKIYVDALDKLSNLTVPGLKVFTYILSKLKISKDYIYIRSNEAMEFCGYTSKSDIYKGIANLLEQQLIARRVGMDGIYFINYDAFYNGSRLKNTPFDI